MSASVEEDICFDVDGTATTGRCVVPAHRKGQRLAAALLLPGSGPVDRNGDVPGLNLTPRTLALIAEVLARLGIMSLRFDKYSPAGPARAPIRRIPAGSISTPSSGRRGRLPVLGARRETRPEALLVAGHSEGGPVRAAHRGAGAAAPGRDRADRAHGRAAAQHDRTAGHGRAQRGRRRGYARPRRRGRERQRGPARDRRVPCGRRWTTAGCCPTSCAGSGRGCSSRRTRGTYARGTPCLR